MQTQQLGTSVDKHSPAGAQVRFLLQNQAGGMIHSTVPAGQINRAIVHKRVSEFWYVLSGEGEIWRKQNEQETVTKLVAGTSIDILPSTQFQYRNIGEADFKFICITIPPWPGADEAEFVEGHWQANYQP